MMRKALFSLVWLLLLAHCPAVASAGLQKLQAATMCTLPILGSSFHLVKQPRQDYLRAISQGYGLEQALPMAVGRRRCAPRRGWRRYRARQMRMTTRLMAPYSSSCSGCGCCRRRPE